MKLNSPSNSLTIKLTLIFNIFIYNSYLTTIDCKIYKMIDLHNRSHKNRNLKLLQPLHRIIFYMKILPTTNHHQPAFSICTTPRNIMDDVTKSALFSVPFNYRFILAK